MMLAGACAVQIGAANLVDPYVCRNVIRDLPEVMKKYGIADGDMVRASSPVGSICGIAAVYLNSQPGIVHVYHGNAKGEANDLIDRNYLDPISGFPGYKSYFCKIEKEKGEVKA